MHEKKYSASAVKLSFWFAEFRKVISFLHSGKSLNDIKELAVTDNIFSAATPMRSEQIFNTVTSRVLSLPEDYHNLFEKSNLETQKIIALIAVMETDALFYDFMNDVYREKLITGNTILTDADIRIFFTDKQRESEKVSGWTDATLDRLKRCYKTYLSEAGLLLERGKGDRKIIKPLIDNRLSALLAETNKNQIVSILLGTR